MTVQQMIYFKTVAELEHMSKAAQKLHTAQPGISYAIAELEKELNVPLFKRTGRNISLTRYGKELYKYIARALNEMDSGVRHVKGLSSPNEGTIIFSYYHSLGSKLVPDLITKFYSLDDTKNIRFELHQEPTDEIIQRLKIEECDLALASLQEDPEIDYLPIFKEELVIAVPKSHPLAQKKNVDLGDIRDEPFIAYRQNTGLRRVIDGILEQAGIIPNIVCETVDNETNLGLVSGGLGVAIGPRIFGIEAYPVVLYPIRKSMYKRYIYLLWKKDSYMSPAAKRFKQLIIDQISL